MMEKKIKFGIIGAGLMGNRRAESLSSLSEAEIISIADIDEDKAKNLAEKYSCNYSKNYKDIFNDKNINCVIVSVINNQLAKITKEALEKNKHVLVEKPVAISLKEIEELITLSNQKNLIVKAGFNHRFFPTIKKAKELFDKEEIGELLFIKATYGQKGRIGFEKEWRAKKEIAGGGELIDQGVHIIDLCRLFMGDIKKVYGITPTLFWNINVDDNDFLILKSNKEKIAFVHTSSSLWRNTFIFEIHGTRGILEINGLRDRYGIPKLKILKRNEEKSKEVGVYQFNEEEIIFPDEDVSWTEEMKNFINAVKRNEEVYGSLEDAKKVLKTVFEVYSK